MKISELEPGKGTVQNGYLIYHYSVKDYVVMDPEQKTFGTDDPLRLFQYLEAQEHLRNIHFDF